MAIRRQVSVSDEVWKQLRALEFVTGRTQGALVAQAIRALLDDDPGLAERVVRAGQVAA